ncbi:nuclear transport factor 2 family protein [Frankia sp. AgB1.9]|uniref:nuclear transport factor 2 family protein n=1 Tax=unclassified Frankia TaxID=2632575 RepID=UPI001931F739|nr:MULTISPECIES: nuclear transport factor 2 family protein [unclassified Frankia]MBL7489364.1 nuclear transport factor 2 family protein [Frankia sp. AgW1.1]MBL7548699.1 nuclear transport factor 2 family protein [Frankia sp. AgB1.9]MBL7619297.1 nuclear transport factor 2 family protein [Frankia sp. AgB1.8]
MGVTVVPVDAATYAEVCDLLARHPHLFDNLALAAVPGAYTADAVMGEAPLAQVVGGLPFGRVMFPHHTTDVAVHRVDDDTLRVWAKYFVIRGDGTAGSGDYQDTVVRTPLGWRIAERQVTRGNRPDDDPDGPSTRSLSTATWLAPLPAGEAAPVRAAS